MQAPFYFTFSVDYLFSFYGTLYNYCPRSGSLVPYGTVFVNHTKQNNKKI